MLSKTIDCLSMSMATHKEAGFFCSSCFKSLLTCYGLFQVVQLSTCNDIQNVLTCKFTINQLHVDFITKECKRYYKVGQLKEGQVLQSGAGFTKLGNFFHKFGQLSQRSAVQKANEINEGGQ